MLNHTKICVDKIIMFTVTKKIVDVTASKLLKYEWIQFNVPSRRNAWASLHTNLVLRPRNWVGGWLLQVMKQIQSLTLQAALATARYSASQENEETPFCFLNFQAMREDQRKIQKPVTGILLSWHDTQSESLKAFSFKLESEENRRPVPW